MGLISYLNTLAGGSIVERTYDNLTRSTDGRLLATGGTIIDDGGFRIHVFTSPGSFVVSSLGAGPGTVEYLVVAGGGGGGSIAAQGGGGGGGAGGLYTTDANIPTPLRQSPIPITTGTYPITV